MAYSNANFLMTPNRLSTKVHHAPGGASSLSLAWDEGEKSKRERIKQPEEHLKKHNTEPPKNIVHHTPQLQKSEHFSHKNYYEPAYPGFLSMSESNRILEEELQYYQNRNKMLRQNLFANQQNAELINNYSIKHPQHSYQLDSSRYTEDDYFSRSQDYGQGSKARQTEELEMAILQQQKRRAMEKQESNYNGYYAMGQMGGQMLQKPSVKVSNPPGGRSSIIFG